MTKSNSYYGSFLKDFSIWVVLKCLFVILTWIKTSEEKGFFDFIASEIYSGLVGFIPVWFFGAVASSIPLISVGAMAGYIFVLFSIISNNHDLRNRARKILWIILGMSLFTLWIEPYITMFTISSQIGKVVANTLFLVVFDIVASAIWIVMTITVNRKLSSENLKNNKLSGNLSRNINLFKTIFFSSIGGGYLYLGQVSKGVIFILYSLLSLQNLFFFLPVYFLSIIDAYRLTRRHNQYENIKKWSTCLNPYTIGVVFLVFLL